MWAASFLNIRIYIIVIVIVCLIYFLTIWFVTLILYQINTGFLNTQLELIVLMRYAVAALDIDAIDIS